MATEEPTNLQTPQPETPSAREAAWYYVMKLANEDEMREFAAALPKGSKLLGMFAKDGTPLALPGQPPSHSKLHYKLEPMPD